MIAKSVRRIGAFRVALFALAATIGLLANRAQAVTTYQFDVNGTAAGFGITTGSTYDWDATTNGGFWDTSAAGTGPISGWVQGNFPKFSPTGTPTYTVTVSNDEQITGLFASTAQTLTINAIGSGDLNSVDTGSMNGFLGSGSNTVKINAPIVGAGTVNPSNGGNIDLFGTNTYTRGTALTSTGALTHFNNSSSFGTGTIYLSVATAGGFAPLLGAGATTISFANTFLATTTGAGVNFAADANTPVVSTGTWNLGTNNVLLRNNGTSGSPLTISGVITGTATDGPNITLSANNSGLIIFRGANTYTGDTNVSAGTTPVTLRLGAANTIASSERVTLSGGILDPGGFVHTMTSTVLNLFSTSTINMSTGGEIDFSENTNLEGWGTGSLNIIGLLNSNAKLRFGTDQNGLRSDQLEQIEFNSNSATLGSGWLTNDGYLVPEPSSALVLLGAPLLLRRRRRAA